jgi:gamma-glutamyltranspeptidase
LDVALTEWPISSGGTALLAMLNVLGGYDLKAKAFGSADMPAEQRRGDPVAGTGLCP